MNGRAPAAVNLLWCLPGQVGGSEEYSVRQLLGLRSAHHDAPVRLFVNPSFAAAYPELAERFDTVVCPPVGDSRLRRIRIESTWLRSVTAEASVVHHAGGTAPVRPRRPYTVLVHDLQYREFPEYFSTRKRRYLDLVLPRSVRNAAAVGVPTEFVKRTVIDAYGISADQIVVVPHGLDPDLLGPSTPGDELRARFGLGDGPLFVYPAVTHPHKNHRFLSRLLAERVTDPHARLVFIGGSGLAEADATAGVDDPRLVRLGRVNPADRNGFLRTAEAMLFPSQYEGFGAPLIEAMALGCPVICSDAACIPEVVGDAALVRPLDLDAWSEAIHAAPIQRSELVARGHACAAEFSPERSGEALWRLLQAGGAR